MFGTLIICLLCQKATVLLGTVIKGHENAVVFEFPTPDF